MLIASSGTSMSSQPVSPPETGTAPKSVTTSRSFGSASAVTRTRRAGPTSFSMSMSKSNASSACGS
jgi:hypothetical protein